MQYILILYKKSSPDAVIFLSLKQTSILTQPTFYFPSEIPQKYQIPKEAAGQNPLQISVGRLFLYHLQNLAQTCAECQINTIIL